MAVSSTELSDEEFFTQLGMLIIQGRKWDSFRQCRIRGFHCPAVKNSSPPHHQCIASNIECHTALVHRNSIQAIWRCDIAMGIDVLLLPECGHQAPSIVLEKWTLQYVNGNSTMPKLSLMQAIDSTIHFSQLSSWWASTNGCQPQNVHYRIYQVGDSPDESQFSELPIYHQFPVSQGIRVQVQYLPRQRKIPELQCPQCSSTCNTQSVKTLNVGSPSRGRSFTLNGHRRGSRHSSASSDSLSPSVTRLDISPYGSPLLSPCLRRGLSSSSSSRDSSRNASPSISRSSSECNMILTFEASCQMNDQMEEQVEEVTENTMSRRNDSGFVDQMCEDSMILNQDEEFDRQLDSLSDSDLSDDYVIDGPVGSPGLLGSCVMSPDDARVQILQSTFGGFHCRRPTFDRLMSDSTLGRTRHSSLDSAVSNLERLELRAQRRLSRTSSDGQEFPIRTHAPCNSEECNKDFFIRDIKKRHKIYSLDLPTDKETQSSYTLNNTFYASFITNSDTSWKKYPRSKSPILYCFNPLDVEKNSGSRDEFQIQPENSHGLYKSSSLTHSMPCLSSNEHSELAPIHCDMDVSDKHNHGDNFPLDFNDNSTVPNQNHPNDTAPIQVPSVSFSNGELNISRKSEVGRVGSDHHDDVPRSDFPHFNTRYNTVQPFEVKQRPDVDNDNEYGNLPIIAKQADNSKNANTLKDDCEIANTSSSALLRSPPSKLRILPSHCVKENFLNNPPRRAVHKAACIVQRKPARRLQFNPTTEKPPCSSPAPIRRNNSIRFEFDEDMPRSNQRSSRSMCRGKCMKKNGTVVHNHTRSIPSLRLLGSFEESILHGCLGELGTVEGFTAQLGASGSFCPPKVKLPVPVRFFHVSDDNAPSPYMGTMSLKGRDCGKRGYHIPRKGTIQLTLFNPNNSVVKVFVILYDVSDMPPGHRTFLRHRIYSRASSADSVAKWDATDSLLAVEDQNRGNTTSTNCLRYLVNLWLESSKTNKVYIHGDIKILFSLASNEWDSGNTFELRAETEFPKNPKFSSKR